MQQSDTTKANRCASCGYRSANRAFFRHERSKASGLKWTFCTACEPYDPTPIEVASYFNACVTGLAALLILVFGDPGMERLGYFFLFFGVLGWSSLVTVTAHEMGHALLGRP